MDEKEDQPSDIRHYRNIAKRIVQQCFGKAASRIVYKSSGRTNFVFAVNHVEGQFVVRISPDANRIEAFQKELRASNKARAAGVPTPEVLAVGADPDSEPYMITRRVTGIEASQNPKRLNIVHQMGEYAAVIIQFLQAGSEPISSGPRLGIKTARGKVICRTNSSLKNECRSFQPTEYFQERN